MKKKTFLTAGVLIGIGAFYGARQMQSLASDTAQHINNGPRAERALVAKAIEKERANAAPIDSLVSKIERLRAWTNGKDRSLGREGALKILGEWARADAHAALDFVCAAPQFPHRNIAYAIPLAVISRSNPKEVINWLSHQIAVDGDRSDIAEAIGWRSLSEAPAAALEVVTAFGIVENGNLFGQLLGKVARTQPQLALQSLAQGKPEIQKRALRTMLDSWAETNPTEALAWYTSYGLPDAEAARALATGCVKSGQYSVPDVAAQLRLDAEQTDRMLYDLSWEGVALDPQSLGLLSDHTRRHVAEIASRKLEESPDRVLAFVKATVKADQQADVLLDGWTSWLNSDRKAAQEWLQQLSDRRLASELPARLERQEQLRDPQKALVLAKTIVDQQERKEMVADAVQHLVWRDPAVAAAWLTQNPGDVPRPGTFRTLANSYLEKDDAGAMAWIAKLGPGSSRDEALSAAATFWVDKEIDFATASMSAIDDAQKRQVCMFNVYRSLNRANAVKADQWLETQGLSAEVRQSWKALGQTSATRYE